MLDTSAITTGARPFSPRRRWAALSVLAAVVLLLSVDNTVLSLAVPALSEALAPSAEQILWIGDIYSLTLAGLLVLMGSLADRFGRKRVLLIGAVAFGLASVLAAFSPSAEMLIVARLLLGVAGATLMPSTLSLIRNIFTDPAERTRAIAIWSTAFGAGGALGPLVGGFLLEHFWWGAVFLINVPIMIIVLVAGTMLLPESKDPNPGRFDVVSAVLSMVAIVPIVFAITHVVGSGVDAFVIGSLIVGLTGGVLFVRRQRRVANPMLDVDLFRVPAFSGAVLASLISILAFAGLVFFFSQYLQFARGYTPLQAGLAELPSTIASIVVVVFIGVAVTRLGRGRAIAAGLILTAAGLVLVALTASNDTYLWLGVALTAVGLGFGLSMTLAGDAIVSAAPPHKAGSVSAISETANELGVVLGIAVLGSLLSAVYRATVSIPDTVTGAVRARVEDSLASAMTVLDPGSPLVDSARSAFVTAMQTTAMVAAALTFVAALMAWWLIPSPRGTTETTAEPVGENGTS
ncbi:DHA2 family multidrug resistance protein-like MFS transporter [Kibdelosporangium banguiense]|uniref:DHA2 family multidrug resistance protein-like MFS transporter n=1 Tax=Kibdelosporangium banguiense TaxID=1365924 RepID=A0ABS4TVK4_9PSEU|nr:MFS transporter [Kibdelosporangium banguiense]MBP2328014.1 DHA2 family multidrug resistance protein-like MFS transporter [Kibdelosporangium banguiense]